ncbi:MAG: aldolase/citrate lyase family protein [Pirellulales bacterium]
MTTVFRDALAAGKPLNVFSLGRLCHPTAIEMFAQAGGYDGVWLDQEHSGLTAEQIQIAAITARANGLGSLVRMPFTHPSLVSQNLESGVEGVMAARIDSAAQADAFVRWCRFAPRGFRGMNTQGADGWYSRRTALEQSVAARDTFVGVQIESLGALDDLEAIARTPDLDMLFVGPADLSQELGVLGKPDSPIVWEAIERVAKLSRAHGKMWGIVPFGPASAERCLNLGCGMLTVGSDCHGLRMGIDALKSTYRAAFEKRL